LKGGPIHGGKGPLILRRGWKKKKRDAGWSVRWRKKRRNSERFIGERIQRREASSSSEGRRRQILAKREAGFRTFRRCKGAFGRSIIRKKKHNGRGKEIFPENFRRRKKEEKA